MVVTHSLTALMTAISILAVGILSLPFLKGRNEYNGAGRVFIIVVIAMAVGALLSAWYSVPVLAELRWTQVGQGYTMSHWKGTFGLWGYIFDLGFPMQYGNRWAPARPVPVYSIPVAIAVSFCAFASREARFRLFALVCACNYNLLNMDDNSWKRVAVARCRGRTRKAAVHLAISGLSWFRHIVDGGSVP